ncbi:FAD-dependent urate hydroxylase HpyO, FAD/NAD(P)-binding domain containing protein [Fimbriimonadaceae bacterium]
MKIGIVGGGASGALVAAHLVRSGLPKDAISIFDRSGFVGSGAAYGASTENYLLNVPAGKMSAYADEPSHFADWLVQRGLGIEVEVSAKFVARQRYGQYLRDLIQDVSVISEEVSLIEFRSGQFKIGDRDFDHLVLALGNAEPTLPPQFTRFKDHPGFRKSTWRNLPAEIRSDDRVLIIGTGLTMLDALCELSARGFRGQVTAVSRHGFLPQPHQPTTPVPYTGTTTLRTILKYIRKAEDWRAAIDGLRPTSQKIWKEFSLREKRQFLRHARPYWEVHRHRAPAQTYQLAQDWIRTGQLSIHLAANFDPGQSSFDWVFNATGPNQRLASRAVPIIESLVERGLASYDELSLGLDPFSLNPGLHAIGTLTLGTLWECTAVPDIRNQAAAIAARILQARP